MGFPMKKPAMAPRPTQGAQFMQMLAGKGQGGDTMLAHATPGEIMVPPNVLDGNPQLTQILQAAFKQAGVPFPGHVVGGSDDPKNPATGLVQFDGGDGGGGDGDGGSNGGGAAGPGGEGGASPGGTGGSDGSNSGDTGASTGASGDSSAGTATGNDGPNGVGPAGPAGPDGTPGANAAGPSGVGPEGGTTGEPGANGPAGVGTSPGGPTGNGNPGEGSPSGTADADGPGMGGPGGVGVGGGGGPAPPITLAQQRAAAAPPPAVAPAPAPQSVLTSFTAKDAPGFLNLSPNMTDLQARSAISTHGVADSDSRWRDPQTVEFQKSMINQALAAAGPTAKLADVLLPTELQYLQQVLNINAHPEDAASTLQGALAAYQPGV